MLKNGWTPNAKEALEAGFVQEVVPHDQLMNRAQSLAEEWVKSGKVRNLVEQNLVEEYRKVNERESWDLANGFVDVPFLDKQYRFLKRKGKTGQAWVFWWLKTTRPIWAKLI